jgi:hypothetical protein
MARDFHPQGFHGNKDPKILPAAQPGSIQGKGNMNRKGEMGMDSDHFCICACIYIPELFVFQMQYLITPNAVSNNCKYNQQPRVSPALHTPFKL